MKLPSSFRKHKSSSSERRDHQPLQFEQCEVRNMLSASSALDLAAFSDSGNEQLVLTHLSANEHTSYLQNGVSDLQLVAVSQNEVGTVSTFQQTVDGLPVHGSTVTVTQGARGAIVDVMDQALSHLVTQDTLTPSLNLDVALQIANSGFHSRDDISSTAELVWFNNGSRAELAWQVSTVAVGFEANNADIELTTVVDAETGDLLSQSQSTLNDDSVVDISDGVHARITINDAIGAAGSRAYAAPFDAVAALTLGCTGTLIAENVVLSARHCGAGAGSTIRFGDNSNSPVFTATVQSSSLPDGNGTLLDGGDVAILTLTSNVPSNVAEPMRLIDETNGLVGQTASLSGFGLNGLGSTGHGNSSDGFRWGGENVIDAYGSPASANGSNIISTDFDDGSNAANTIGSSSATPVEFEATTAPGDSGSGVLVQVNGEWLIAGVLSGGTTANSVYGDISWWTGTAIYRAEIEAAGGVFADGGLGTVGFESDSYLIGESVEVAVNDSNASGPLSVTVTSDAGDTETFNLTGSTTSFSGSIVTADGAVSANDGTLQVADGDVITVTYVDADDGTGNSNTVTDTALIFAPVDGNLVGIDFDLASGLTPANWTRIGGDSNTVYNNLVDENGNATVIDLAIDELSNGSWNDFEATPNANTIPQYANSLANIDGQIFTNADPIRLTYQDLTPGTDYEIYVFSLDTFFASIEQNVTITGAGAPVSFDQIFDSGELAVNGSIGDSNEALASYAQVIEADSNGEIIIDVTPLAGTSDVVLGGLAINEVIPDVVENPFGTKFLDGVPIGGTLADAQFSDDVYYQLAPSPTDTPTKQIVDVILAGEYTDGPVNSFEFRIEATVNGGPAGDVIQRIELRNELTGAWEVIDSRAASTSDEVVQVAASGDLDRFVHPVTSEIFARVVYESQTFSGSTFEWTVDVDQFGWVIS